MQSKQTLFDEFIKAQLNNEVVYKIDIDADDLTPRSDLLHLDPHVQQVALSSIHLVGTGRDGLHLHHASNKAEVDALVEADVENNLSVGTRPTPVLLTREYLNEQVDVDKLTEFWGESLAKDLTDRMRHGELSDDPNESIGRLPPAFRERLMKMVMDRQATLNKSMHWFTFRRDERNAIWVDFPVAAYRFGIPKSTVIYAPKVQEALLRIKARANIIKVTVKGPVPQHWYFGEVSSED